MKKLQFKRLSIRIITYIVILVSGVGFVMGLIMNAINTRNFDYLIGNYYMQREIDHYTTYFNSVFEKQKNHLDEVDRLFPNISQDTLYEAHFKKYIQAKKKINPYRFIFIKGRNAYYLNESGWNRNSLPSFLKNCLTSETDAYSTVLSPGIIDDREYYWLVKKTGPDSWIALGQEWPAIQEKIAVYSTQEDKLLQQIDSSKALLVNDEGIILLCSASNHTENSIEKRYVKETLSLEDIKGLRKILTRAYDHKQYYVCISLLSSTTQYDSSLFVFLELDRKVVMNITSRNGRLLGTIGTFFILLLMIGVSTILILNLVRPLERLKDAALKVSEENFDIMVPEDREDEFGEVARTFLRMVSSIKNHRTNLEQEIQKRTQELKSALKYLEDKEIEVQQEMNLASSIQKGLMSSQDKWNRLFLYPYVNQVEDIGGDFVDNIALPDRFLFYLSDVSGHGIPAALISILTKVIILYSFQQNEDLKDIISDTNEKLNSIVSDDGIGYKNYLTIFVAQIRPDYSFQYLSAGHVPAIKYISKTRECAELGTTSSMLGVFDSRMIVFKPEDEQLDPGDKLVIFSDGFVNALNIEGIHFGLQRIMYLVQENGEKKAREIRLTLLTAWEEFMVGSEIKDDVSLLVVERKK